MESLKEIFRNKIENQIKIKRDIKKDIIFNPYVLQKEYIIKTKRIY